MEIKEIQVRTFYTCQFCGKEFESKVDFYIVQAYFPFCNAYKCKFNFLYNLIKKLGYSEEELVFMLESIKVKPSFNSEKHLELNSTYFELTKTYIKILDLSYIKGELVQELVQKKLVQKVEPVQKLVQAKSLCNKDLDQFEPKPVFETNQGVSNKWF